MFIKKIDLISPPITLYFNGRKSHVSIYSGILSIIYCLIVLGFMILYIIYFIRKNSPKAYFFTRHIEDAGAFPLNSTQMFNFIQLTDPDDNYKAPMDFEAFRIIGFEDVYADEYMNNISLIKERNHWVYGYCNNNSDTKGISHLITQEYYEQSACIRKYFDAKKQKYFNTEEEGFRWPVLLKGCSNPNRTYYGIIIQRCDMADDFLKQQGPNCKSSAEIDKVITEVSLDFQIIDHIADMLNYKIPFTTFFKSITSGILDNYFIVQNLNFNPAAMVTHDGLFLEHEDIKNSYFLIQNEKMTLIEQELRNKSQSTNGCLIGIYFWMQNILQYYERHYDKVQDVLSQIGGIKSIVLTIISTLNLLIHNFIVILDTEEITLNLEHENYKNRSGLNRQPIIYKVANTVMLPPKRPNEIGNQSSKVQLKKSVNNHEEIFSDENTDEEHKEELKDIDMKKNNLFNNKKNQDGNDNPKSLIITFANRMGNQNNIKDKKNRCTYGQHKDTYPKISIDENTFVKDKKIKRKPIEKEYLNCCKYLGYLICCKRKAKKFFYYENFRTKLISEENIINNHMNLCKLLKICNFKKQLSLSENADKLKV